MLEPQPPAAATAALRGGIPPALAILFGAALVVAAYFPALRGGLLWDDDRHVTQPALRSLAGLGQIWTELGTTQQYYPLLHSSFWLEHRLWGDAVLGYHLVNIAQHLLGACLLVLVLQRLNVRGAWLAAAVFALHPVQVESVAWISEQKNTLSLVFYLGATLAYLKFNDTRSSPSYVAALLLFILGLLTKTTVATLPGALLVILWWHRGHLSWRRDVLPLAPWIVLGAIAGIGTAWLERSLIGAEGEAFALTWWQRITLAGRVVWFYFFKLLWPSNLSFIYPRWNIVATHPDQWLPALALLSLLVLAWRSRRFSRTPLALILLFGGALFPVLGFLNVYPFQYSYVADHFQYLATLPLCAAAGAALDRVGTYSARMRPLAIVAVAALFLLTWRQSYAYRDVRSLYTTTLARNPGCWMAHNNLGKELMADKAQLPEAIRHFRRAVALRPEYPEALNNLGLALTQVGRADEAVPHIEHSLRLKPNVFQAHNNLGIALASSGRPSEAVSAFERAAALNPKLPNIHENWAKALLMLNRTTEATARFEHAARLRATQSRPTSLPKPP
jgi:protein O-mannosyl-transferase